MAGRYDPRVNHDIRRLGVEDAEAYIAIRQEMLRAEPWAFWSSPEDRHASDPEAFGERVREDENVMMGGFVAGALSATCGVVRERVIKGRHRAMIVGVYVSPSARGGGLGRAVVSAAVDVARSWEGVESVVLSVSARMPAARQLYESLGFVAWGVEPRCVKIGDEAADEIHMQLRLRP
ncbi:MAG: N-acetyltransferase [Phycisphaeraceae bacterium]|nr:MAG: N-acetyltransferase [Phycisphaeraceae bacterium]